MKKKKVITVLIEKCLSMRSRLVAHQAGDYPGFRSMKRLGVFLHPLDGMLVQRRVPPSSKFSGNQLYTWVERGTVRVKCLAQEHNTVNLVKARTQTARCGIQRIFSRNQYINTI